MSHSPTAPASTSPVQMPHSAAVGSPEWWLHELENELSYRMPLVELYEDYFEGRHRLNFVTSKYRETFAQMLAGIADNWIPLIISAQVERLRVQGFLFGEDRKSDDEAQRIWRANDMGTDAPLAFTEAAKHGEAYLLVWPDRPIQRPGIFGRFFQRRSEGLPRITIEHPGQVVVRREPGDRRRRAAALKRWQEDDGTLMATLYLPEETHRFQRKKDTGSWEARDGVAPSSPNPLGVVPMVPLVNDPHAMPCKPPTALTLKPHGVPSDASIGYGRAEQADAISTVDQINKLLCDMIVASEVAAYRQRWATGLDIEPDEESGESQEPFKAAVDRLWYTPNENARFGDFEASNLENYTKAIEQRIQSLAARTRTPPHYLLGRVVNASGDALKAAETGLASKVKGRQPPAASGLVEAIQIAFAWMENDRADEPGQVSWGHAESRSESEFVDSLVKKLSIGVPMEQLWEDAGYSPEQIKRFKRMLEEQAQLAGEIEPPDPAEEPPPEPDPADLPVDA